jgi:hypothetical protein
MYKLQNITLKYCDLFGDGSSGRIFFFFANDHLAMAEDPSASGLIYLSKYFQIFPDFIP